MIRFCMYFLLILPLGAQAFDFSKLSEMAGDPEKMQQEAEKMAKGMAEAGNCFDVEAMEKMQIDGQAVTNQIKALCAKGDRKGAEKVTIEYAKKMATSAEFQKLKKCGAELMAHLPPGHAQEMSTKAAKGETTSKSEQHICDMQN